MHRHAPEDYSDGCIFANQSSPKIVHSRDRVPWTFESLTENRDLAGFELSVLLKTQFDLHEHHTVIHR